MISSAMLVGVSSVTLGHGRHLKAAGTRAPSPAAPPPPSAGDQTTPRISVASYQVGDVVRSSIGISFEIGPRSERTTFYYTIVKQGEEEHESSIPKCSGGHTPPVGKEYVSKEHFCGDEGPVTIRAVMCNSTESGTEETALEEKVIDARPYTPLPPGRPVVQPLDPSCSFALANGEGEMTCVVSHDADEISLELSVADHVCSNAMFGSQLECEEQYATWGPMPLCDHLNGIHPPCMVSCVCVCVDMVLCGMTDTHSCTPTTPPLTETLRLSLS
jgi:hypothetical protein